jgi:hypothetical protein
MRPVMRDNRIRRIVENKELWTPGFTYIYFD